MTVFPDAVPALAEANQDANIAPTHFSEYNHSFGKGLLCSDRFGDISLVEEWCGKTRSCERLIWESEKAVCDVGIEAAVVLAAANNRW